MRSFDSVFVVFSSSSSSLVKLFFPSSPATLLVPSRSSWIGGTIFWQLTSTTVTDRPFEKLFGMLNILFIFFSFVSLKKKKSKIKFKLRTRESEWGGQNRYRTPSPESGVPTRSVPRVRRWLDLTHNFLRGYFTDFFLFFLILVHDRGQQFSKYLFQKLGLPLFSLF